jgi:hypothetical protein
MTTQLSALLAPYLMHERLIEAQSRRRPGAPLFDPRSPRSPLA